MQRMPRLAPRALAWLAILSGAWGCSSSNTNPGDGAGGSSGTPIETVATITSDSDDGVWLEGTNENLRTGAAENTIEVGNDSEGARAGLRFQLAVPKRASIQSALLELQREMGPATATETILIQVFDDASVAPFDDGHAHTPAEHAAGGLLPQVVGGFPVGEQEEKLTSPDVAVLVQHVVNREDWSANAFIGFVLAPDSLEEWASFRDSSSGGVGSRLRVTFLP
jgi:hypothetical protein